MPSRPVIAAISISLGALLAACGGGGASTGRAELLPQPPGPVPTSNVVITIETSQPTSAGRQPLYVSPGTKSMRLTVAGATGATTTVVSNCTTSCQAAVQAPVGVDKFAIGLYDAKDAGGNLLLAAVTTATIVAGQTNSVNLVFGGAISKLAISAGSTPQPGVAGSVPLNVMAYDADGYTIVGSAAYASPITLTLSDPKGATSLSTSTVTSPAGRAALAYNGAASGANATVTASTSGVDAASTTVSISSGASPAQPTAPSPIPGAAATFAGCQMGQPDDIWNHDVRNDPVDPNSASFVANTDTVDRETFYAAVPLEAINVGDNSTPVVPAHSGRGPTSVGFVASTFRFEHSPPSLVADGGDSHFMYLNTQTCIYTELYATSYSNGVINYYSGNAQATAAHNTGRYLSMDPAQNSYTTAGGLDIFPAAIKYEEIVAGAIEHAMVIGLNVNAVSNSQYVFPGGPQLSGNYTEPGEPLAYGHHLRLKPSYSNPSATPECTTVLTALKHYGGYVNDESSPGVSHPVYFADGIGDPLGNGYKNMNFDCLGKLNLGDFEVLVPTPR